MTMFTDVLGYRTIPACFYGPLERAAPEVPSRVQCDPPALLTCPECERPLPSRWGLTNHLANPAGWCVEFARKHKLGKFSPA